MQFRHFWFISGTELRMIRAGENLLIRIIIIIIIKNNHRSCPAPPAPTIIIPATGINEMVRNVLQGNLHRDMERLYATAAANCFGLLRYTAEAKGNCYIFTSVHILCLRNSALPPTVPPTEATPVHAGQRICAVHGVQHHHRPPVCRTHCR